MKRIYLLLAALLGLTLTLAACGSSGSSKQTNSPPPNTQSAPGTAAGSATGLPTAPGSITVGSADFPESTLLADIYAGAMSAKGVQVTKKLNIGERSAYMAALNDGSIGFIPEYTGSILVYLDKSATAKTPDEVYAALKQAASGQGLVALQFAAAQDSDTITVTKQTADKYHLTSIADLKSVAGKLTFGAPAQFKTRADGIPALKSVYGVEFGRFTALQAGGTITVTALKNGSIDAGDIFSTDPSIAKNNFVSLTDPKSMFAAQNIVPLFAQAKLSQPMADACNAVSAKLDTATLAGLVAKVADGADPDSVAKDWLSSAGLS
ncbi:ABC transporter substrate-binding protein [Jatrophihabitans cynanchi]|jgi:osmoprotectant transport system substrate-binding protein|uniref:ABC transporter substrate-binding protein n=1 Tax=Jatrophihabitans cynanchi TaxID=2944128 RepID=A0ABY7JTP0_9ACTN|nr:ABC transporter substrate-binding protein [Jatrophihabitans sp. SB3-54]WAX55400.1 ABC transporter substrate-binding protein [Jatrophihabitans sp. SB3-54]